MRWSDRLLKIPLLVLVSAFITLDFILLSLNLNISRQLEADARSINIIGRQRMLTQQLGKNMIVLAHVRGADLAFHLNDINKAARIFDQTLVSLTEGGAVKAPNDRIIAINAVTDPIQQKLLEQALVLWAPMYERIKGLFRGSVPHDAEIFHRWADEESNQLLQLMNQLTIRAEQLSNENTLKMRRLQLIVFGLVFLNFVLILQRFHFQSAASKRTIKQMESLATHLNEAILLLDHQQRVVFSNKAAQRLFHQSSEEIVRQQITTLLGAPADEHILEFEGRHIQLRKASIDAHPKPLQMLSLLDVSENISLQNQLRIDPLTRLPNRTALNLEYRRMRDQNTSLSCLFIDLDRFKQVNDAHGHPVGDSVLAIAAHRIQRALKQTDLVARIGGDEFVALLPSPGSTDEMIALCERIQQRVQEPIHLENSQCQLGVSIGIRTSSSPDDDLESLIRDADEAMYQAKKQGAVCRFYHPGA